MWLRLDKNYFSWVEKTGYGARKKKLRKTERSMTTALFMLLCVQLGLSIADLDLLTIGSVNDMFNEKSRDSMEWREEATQADMDRI